MSESNADEHAAQTSALRAKKIRLLRAEGLKPDTPDATVEEMVQAVDITDLAASLAAVKSRWSEWFGTPRSADKHAARAMA